MVVWELAIDRRAMSTPEPEPDCTIAFAAAKAKASSHATRCAVEVVSKTRGVVGQLGRIIQNLPLVVADEIDVSGFPLLAKLKPDTKKLSASRVRSLALRVGITVPGDDDITEEDLAKWVWDLALLSKSLTCKAVGWLQTAMSDQAKWDAAVAALQPDGRFTAEWMTAAQAQRDAAAASAAVGAREGSARGRPPHKNSHPPRPRFYVERMSVCTESITRGARRDDVTTKWRRLTSATGRDGRVTSYDVTPDARPEADGPVPQPRPTLLCH